MSELQNHEITFNCCDYVFNDHHNWTGFLIRACSLEAMSNVVFIISVSDEPYTLHCAFIYNIHSHVSLCLYVRTTYVVRRINARLTSDIDGCYSFKFLRSSAPSFLLEILARGKMYEVAFSYVVWPAAHECTAPLCRQDYSETTVGVTTCYKSSARRASPLTMANEWYWS